MAEESGHAVQDKLARTPIGNPASAAFEFAVSPQFVARRL